MGNTTVSAVKRIGGTVTFERGEGVALDRTEQNGLLVRMLGDVKGSATVETSLTPSVGAPGSSDAWRNSAGSASSSVAASTGMGSSSVGGDMNVGEAEERLLRGVVRGTSSCNRFMTLHRRRRRKPPTRLIGLEQHHQALLDDLYHGPTQCVLSHVGVWSFNAFALDSVCGGRPVSVLCVYLLHKYGLIQHFNFDTVTVWKCFSLIEDGYHSSNPYHNAIHAADVTQAMHCYLQEDKIREHMTPLEMLAALVAAVCHDLDHPGVNQPFLIATDNHLAALYKNLSVLENHHWRCAMGCLWESGLLDSWDPKDVSSLQDMIRSLILATDITRQQEFLSKFKRYLDANSFDMRDPDHRHFSLQIGLKCADICNPCRPWDISQKWSYKICDEFYRQGDYERQLNLPVTSLCDRYVMSVAKIQTGFIKHVVSPLFEDWDCWLRTKLSTSMVNNMNKNLALWEEQLAQEAAEKTTTDIPITSLDSPQMAEEGTEEDPDEVDGVTTPSSSGDSHQSVLGSLENLSRSLQLGRRHSVPLNQPRLVPRTVIRRESLPEVGGQPLVVETVMMGGLSLTSFSSHVFDPNTTLTAESLLPDPSITTMGGVSNGRSRLTSRLTRRKSLPPLWSQHPRSRPLQILKPMSPTPSEDSTSPQNTQENSPPSDESEKRTEVVGNSAQGSGGDSGNDCEDSGGCGGSNNIGDCCESNGQTNRSTRGDAVPSVRESGVHSRKSVQSYQGATFLHSDCSDGLHYRALGGKVLVRRASLDSTSISSKREFLDRLAHEGSKFARVERSNSEMDKENKAPREPLITRDRQVPLWKTRAWRSLNYEDENTGDPREKMIKPGIYKLNQTQGSMFAHGRRGSAPLLRPEELWGGLRGGAERPDQRYLSTRRGSAPSQPIHQGLNKLKLGHAGGLLGACGGGGGGGGVGGIGAGKIGGLPPLKRQRAFPQPLNRTNSFSILEPFIASISGSDTDSGPEMPGSPRTPLTSTENLPISDTPFGHSRLRGRRGSVPFDVPGSDVGFELSLMKDHSEKRFSRRGSGGSEMLPSLVARAHSSLSATYGGHGVSGGGSGGAGIPSSMGHHHQDFHRGSGGLDLFAGLWRSHLETGSSLHDDHDLFSQSSGGMTPSTPGALPPPRAAMPHTLHRRGSLPTDLFYSVCGIVRGHSNISARAQRFRLNPILLPASSANLPTTPPSAHL
ncbi:uncharacterized protein LOC121858828 isoform X2 [Homarus americanus]|uniref:uncharacterized protein LOC121858828 isoform X2 n=1 Tax=Homarus americanus TaxID=6706 RepID=UPI001C4833FA|nr:uncharacterized protein LOC121858828 isoform X2 [Homarus americanus]